MVLSSVATSIINRFLSPFLDELSSNQLKFFGLSGKASLENVSVKPNAFDLLKLPIRVVHSQIGRIDISVPWTNLYTEPIVIKVSDVYLLALPNWEVKYDEEEEALFAWKAKKSALETFESMKQKFKEEQEGKKTDDGFFVKLISAAIKNIQISINNVHIVYEDSTTCKNPFQVGVNFSKLIFETEIDGVVQANDRIINKMVKLEGFSLYMNTKSIKRLNGFQPSELNKILKNRISKQDHCVENLEYILCPIKFHSRALIHRAPEDDGYQIPVVDLNMNLDTFCLQMSNSQIEMLMLLLKTFTEIRSPYRKWRPNVPVKNNAKIWWEFIFTATMEAGFRQRKREYCWAAIKETCQLRKDYYDLYKRKILGEKIEDVDLEYFEKKLSLNVIITARELAEEKTKDILHQQKLDKEAQAKKGWFSGWFSKSSENKDTSSTLKIIKDEFDGGEKQKLYEAIGYEENGNLIFYPPEFIAYKVKFGINMFKIVVKEDVTPLLNIEFEKSIFSVHYRPTSTNLFVQSELSRLTVVGLHGVTLLKGCEREKLLSFMLELNPLDKQSDLKIFLTLKDAHLLYDNETFSRLYQICKPAESLSLEEVANMTEYELADLQQNFQQITSQRIEAAIKNHQQLMLNIQIDPSFVIIPNTGNIDNADAVLLLSLGKLSIESKLESKAVIEETSKKMKAFSVKAEEALEHFDKAAGKPKHLVAEYQCNIQNIQLVLSDADHWKADIECLDTERHILHPLDVSLTATLFIEPEGFKQIFMVDFGAINISRVSPRMVNIALGVLSSFESIKKPKSVAVQENVCTVDLLTPKPIDRKRTWFLNVKPASVGGSEQQNVTIFSENQVLILNMEEVTIHIRISDQDTQPLVRLTMTFNSTMNDYKDLHFDCKFVANYFNTIQGVWEPIIEPVNEKHFALTGDVTLESACTKVKMETEDNMEILLTKTSINLLNNLSNAFLSEMQKASQITSFGEKYKENRVVIRNFLGIPMVIDMASSSLVMAWNESSQDQNYISEEIKPGEEMSFTAENVSNVTLQVILKFSSSNVIERKVVCTKSATRCYFTTINSTLGYENYKWLVKVVDHGTSKEVNFQSNTQIVNYFDRSFIIYSKSGKHVSTVGTISPNGTMNLTLPVAYGKDVLYISPSTDFELSDRPLDWRSLDVVDGACSSKSAKTPLLVLHCPLKSSPEKRYGIKVRAEKINVLFEDTERVDYDEAYLYNIRLLPFVIARNYLPYAAQVSYEAMENEWFDLASGAEKILPYADFGKSCIKYKVINYLGHDWVCEFELPSTGGDKVDHYHEFKATKGDARLNLAVKLQIENNSLVLSLFAPYWMVNQTQESISYKVDSKHLFHHPESLHTKPFLLSFDPAKVSRTNKLCLSVNQSQYTDFFPLNVVPYTGTFLPQSANKKYNLYVGVQTELALIGMSKIITVSSFYNVFNISKKDIEYSENGRDWATITSQSSRAFFPKTTKDQTMCFRFAGTKVYSMPVSLRQSSQTLLPINDEFLFVEVAVDEVEAKVKISDYFYGAAPVLVINDLSTPIHYGQKGVSEWASRLHVSVLPPRHMAFFCWVDPLETRELIYRLEGDERKDGEVINLDFDKYQPIDRSSRWITFFDGKQRVLIFTHNANLPQLLLNTEELNKPSFSLELIFKGLGIDLVDDQKKKDLLYLSIRSSSLWEGSEGGSAFKTLSVKETTILEEMFQLHLKLPVGSSDILCRKGYEVNFSQMKLLRPRSVRLRRLAKQGLWFRYSASEHITQYQLKINTIQVDNQLPEHFYNVAFSPVNTSRESFEKNELQHKSFIEASAIVQSLASVKRYKYVQLLVQEFSLQVDWGWVSQVQSLFDFVPDRGQTVGALIKQDLETIAEDNTLVEMRKFVMGKTYYDYLLLGPMKAHISVSVGNMPDGQFPFGIDFIVRFTGLTLGEINDALIKMDYFERTMTSMSTSELVNQIIGHYKKQIYMQLYKLILGLDIIGNPMKLVLGIQKGIGDFFYEPASAIVLGPEEFVEGIGTGIRSLASGVLGGTAGALGRIGNRLGTGVAALTIDDEFQKERRERMNRKTGFTESGKNLFRGIYSGITGVVTKPIEGASKDGVEGFVKGFGKGVVGVIAQPATGVIDFASGSLNAFDNVIDTKQVIKAVRPPRYFAVDHKLRPYVKHAADGTHILKTLSEGKYAGEQYVYHLQAGQNSLVLLTNRKLFHLKKSMMSSSWEVDWMEGWESVDQVIQDSGRRLRILLKQKKKSMLIFGGVKEYSINLSSEDHAKDLLEHITQHINSAEKRAN